MGEKRKKYVLQILNAILARLNYLDFGNAYNFFNKFNLNHMNKAQLIGNLTKDIELRNTPAGSIVGQGTMATNKTKTDKDGNKTRVATFHNLVIWGKAAEIIAQYAHKGSKLYVEGEINNRSYDGKDGTKRYISEIIVREFEFLDSAKSSEDIPAAEKPQETEQIEEEEIRVENIPF